MWLECLAWDCKARPAEANRVGPFTGGGSQGLLLLDPRVAGAGLAVLAISRIPDALEC